MARKKNLDAPSHVTNILVPQAGGGAASPSDSTDRSLCGEEDAPQDERARKESLIWGEPSTKDTISIMIRLELIGPAS
jgi:hypothetical protein